MTNDFLSLADIINKDPALYNLRKTLKQFDIVADFNKIFPDLEKIAIAVKVVKDVLYLKVDNPAWRSELKFKEKIIVEKVNKYFKEKRIKGVRFI